MKSIFAILLCSVIAANAQFDRNWVGVAFSPYLDQPPARYWDGYSTEDIKAMLRVVRQKFSTISTYGMGVASYNRGKPWDQADSNCRIARAAAELNREGGTKFSVNIGVYQLDDADQQREIDNAFAAANEANAISGGTIDGITFTNEYIFDPYTTNRVLGMIRGNKNRGFRVGVRTQLCGMIYDGGEAADRFRDILRESHFVYCNVYPSADHAQMGPAEAARQVMWYFFYLRDGIQQVNPGIEVRIGETGWPSSGRSFNNCPASDGNLVAYWETMGGLAAQYGVKTQMFQAMNEPWKADNPNGWDAEGHYGWWHKPNNGENRFVEKKTGQISAL